MFRAVDELFVERSVVFSRSTYPGSGQYGQHWLGDNWSEWSNLRWSIIGVLEDKTILLIVLYSVICYSYSYLL